MIPSQVYKIVPDPEVPAQLLLLKDDQILAGSNSLPLLLQEIANDLKKARILEISVLVSALPRGK